MSDLTTTLAQVLTDHQPAVSCDIHDGGAMWTARCTCRRYEQSAAVAVGPDPVLALREGGRRHVAEMLAAAAQHWNATRPRIEIHVNQPGRSLLR